MPFFATDTFRGREGFITPILDDFVKPEYIKHYHVTTHPGCTGLADWARYAIRNMGEPVLYIDIESGREEFLPESEFDPDAAVPYMMKKRGPVNSGILFRLDALPCRYEHRGATNCGLPISQEFTSDYNSLKNDLEAKIKKLDTKTLFSIVKDPSIFTGAQITCFSGSSQVWVQIVHYAMREMGIWHSSFDRVGYSSGDNCIERYPEDFRYESLLMLMKEFGGWIDFEPHGASSMVCNFTTTGKSANGSTGIVQKAYMHPMDSMSPQQRRFADRVYQSFKVR